MEDTEIGPPLSLAFRELLEEGKYTRWAAHLDADTLRVVLWCMGEFGVRMPSGTALPLSLPPDGPSPIRASFALQSLVRIVHGTSLSWEEWKRQLDKALDTAEESGSSGTTEATVIWAHATSNPSITGACLSSSATSATPT